MGEFGVLGVNTLLDEISQGTSNGAFSSVNGGARRFAAFVVECCVAVSTSHKLVTGRVIWVPCRTTRTRCLCVGNQLGRTGGRTGQFEKLVGFCDALRGTTVQDLRIILGTYGPALN